MLCACRERMHKECIGGLHIRESRAYAVDRDEHSESQRRHRLHRSIAAITQCICTFNPSADSVLSAPACVQIICTLIPPDLRLWRVQTPQSHCFAEHRPGQYFEGAPDLVTDACQAQRLPTCRMSGQRRLCGTAGYNGVSNCGGYLRC